MSKNDPRALYSPGVPNWMAATLLSVVAVTLSAGSARGETLPKTPVAITATRVQLSLQQALKIALDQNPRVHQSLLTLAESGEDRRAAASALMPTVAAQAFGQRAKNNLDAFIGIPTPHSPEVVGPFNWGQMGVEARVSLFDLSLWRKWRASQHTEDSARALGRAVREEITALVVGQYLRALRAAASVQADESRVELAEALSKLAENQQKQGVGTKLDTLRAQLQVQTERQRLIQAQTQRTTALAGLSRLLSLEPGTLIELTGTLAAPALPIAGFQEAYRAGLAQRPELAELDAREKATENLRQAAEGLRLPTLIATGAYNTTGLQSQPWATTYQLSLGLRVPLFTGGLVSSQVSRAKSEQARIHESQREVRAQVGYEIQVSQTELDAAVHEVDVAKLAVALSTEALTQARHRFEAGVSNNIEVINAQDELARAHDNQISALYRLNQSRADLARATGQLEALFAR